MLAMNKKEKKLKELLDLLDEISGDYDEVECQLCQVYEAEEKIRKCHTIIKKEMKLLDKRIGNMETLLENF